jgi:hypothetical protein
MESTAMSDAARAAGGRSLEARWAAIETKLAAHAGALAAQGSVVVKVARRRRVAAVRFFVIEEGGKRTQRSVYVGADPELIARACRLLEGYRERAALPGRVEGWARMVAALAALCRRPPGGRRIGKRRAGHGA